MSASGALMESTASAGPSAASEPSSNVVLDSEAMRQHGDGSAVVSNSIDTVDGEPIDFSKHTYGGRGTLHDGERVLYNPRGRAEACTFATMQRRAEEQRQWVPLSDRFRGLLAQLRVPSQAAALATFLPLGNSDRRTRNRVVTAYLDTSYTIFNYSEANNPSPERNDDLGIVCLARGTRVELKHGHMACLTSGEYVFTLHDDVQKAMMIRWPELRSHPDSRLGGHAAASRKQRTCAACGQVWHQTMRRCAACNEVAYCSPVCQRHHWSRHKAACKRARARERLKYDPTVIG